MSWVVLLALGTAVGLWLSVEAARLRTSGRQAARREIWRRSARVAELDRLEETADALVGRKGRFTVRFEEWSNDSGGGTRLVVSGLRSGRDVGLSLRPERASGSGPGEIDTGDREFDDIVSVAGSPALARAVLDSATRRAVAGLIHGSMPVPGRAPLRITGELGDGELRILVPEATVITIFGSEGEPVETSRGFFGPEARLSEVLRFGLELASRIDDPGDLAARIGGNTNGEPDSQVRQANLLELVHEFPDSPATRDALLRALRDPDAVVRLQAGLAVRRLGQEQLDADLVRASRDALLETASGGGAEDETSARALAALGAELAVEEAQGVLREALRTRRTATAAACLAILGARGGERAARTLGKVLVVERGELATAAAEALAQTHDPSAENLLLRALSNRLDAVRVAAARALGRVGSAASVAALHDAESEGGDLRRTARQAIAEIQSRLAQGAGAARGQLSLSEGEAGQISLVGEDVSGRLTLAETPTPRKQL